MTITFLGTGTSMGVPVAGGFGSERLDNDPRNERYRCSAWIESEKSSVLIDTSPEFRLQTIRAGIRQIDLVLITHEHMDHIAGLDDLRSYNYAQNGPIPLYTSDRTAQSIRSRFDYMFGEDKYPGATSVDIDILDSPMQYRDLTITPLPVMHGNLDILGFRINDISYMTDTKQIPEQTKELVRGSRVLVLSGLRWDPPHPTHMTIPEAIKAADELEAEETYLIHMNSYVNHEETSRKLPKHVHLAYDQLTVTV
ncbi:MAG: MBL fold metallo-hydrolase [Balneolaceae bacterium]